MNKKIIKLWSEKVESMPRGAYRLCSFDKSKQEKLYCPLGVLCETLIEMEFPVKRMGSAYCTLNYGQEKSLEIISTKCLSFEIASICKIPFEIQNNIIFMNDKEKLNTKKIIDYINELKDLPDDSFNDNMHLHEKVMNFINLKNQREFIINPMRII